MNAAAKYRILHELGSGGMGRIHKGLLVGQAGFQSPIVIKRLKDADDALHLRVFAARRAVALHVGRGVGVGERRVEFGKPHRETLELLA